jgi:hypothetical protein
MRQQKRNKAHGIIKMAKNDVIYQGGKCRHHAPKNIEKC